MSKRQFINSAVGFRYKIVTETTASLRSGEVEFEIYTGSNISLFGVFNSGRVLEDTINSIVHGTVVKYSLRSNDKISVALKNADEEGKAVSIPFTKVTDFDPKDILTVLERVLNSNSTIALSAVRWVVKYAKQVQGGGGSGKYTFFDCREFVKTKASCIYIPYSRNTDCFWRCLVITLNPTHYRQQWNMLSDKLRIESGLEGKVGMCDFPFIEKKFNITIFVISFDTMKFIYKGDVMGKNKLFLLLDDKSEHYHWVNPDKLGNLWERRKFCFNCLVPYTPNLNVNPEGIHKCVEACEGCHTTKCRGVGKKRVFFKLRCAKCNYLVFNEECRSLHKCNKARMLCRLCDQIYDSKHTHICGEIFCKRCKKNVLKVHDCYFPVIDELKTSKKLAFYDYESFVKKEGFHRFAMAVAMYADSDEVFYFENEDKFISWLYREEHKGYTFIAHNAGRYDTHFIKKKFISRGILTSDIVTGNTFIEVKTIKYGIRFIDSYRFIPIPLRKFPQTFGIKDIKKGFFPYLALRPTHKRTRNIPIPKIEKYGFDRMSSGVRDEGIEWYNTYSSENPIIDIWLECKEYCIDDVKLLKKGCMIFRETFMKIGIDPFQYLTIASVCMNLFRNKFMKEEQIGFYSRDDYESEWMSTIEKEPNHVYLFRNCFDNGCEKCSPVNGTHLSLYKKYSTLRYQAAREVEALEKQGFKVVEMWEHDWKKLRTPTSVLNMRDAFFGGRTEPTYLFYKCKPGEKIRYVDFTSLYPFVQANRKYPIGHPVRYIVDFPPLERCFGFIKCDIEPPKNLFHPVLPERRNGKLIFDLNRKIGTWTTEEVKLAIRKGYIIHKVFEIWDFPRATNDLFKSYVETFLKLKQEAAGWNKLDCKTDEEKEEYIKAFKERENVKLENVSDTYNPGMYFISKLCLNSLWGKFGQREDLLTVADFTDEEEFLKLMFSETAIVKDVFIHDKLSWTVGYKDKDRTTHSTNIPIAAYTTAYGRMHLYSILEKLGERVLYMDTDSVIFVDDGSCDIPTGKFLGDLTDELDGDWIDEFVSSGPKSYAYITAKGKEVLKVKGITLHFQNSEKLSFDVLRDIVKNNEKIETDSLRFVIGKDHSICTKDMIKRLQFTFDKRNIQWFEDDEYFIKTTPFY